MRVKLLFVAFVLACAVTILYLWQKVERATHTPEQTPSILSLEQQSLLSLVYEKVEERTRGIWDKELEIRNVHLSENVVIGKWSAHDRWPWIAWRAEGININPWNVVVASDGFACDDVNNIPTRYRDFIHDVITLNTIKGELLHVYGDDCVLSDFVPAQYRDSGTGFVFSIPKVLEEVEHVISASPQPDGGMEYRIILQAKNEFDYPIDFTTASVISAVPVVFYKPNTCAYSDGLCIPGEEIGRNSRFVFVSENFSPEAWGACTRGTPSFDEAFYRSNNMLCDTGRTPLSQLERNPGVFEVFELDRR